MEELKPDYRNKIVEIYRRIAFADESLSANIENIIFEWVKSELLKKGEVFDCYHIQFKLLYLRKTDQLYLNINPESEINNKNLLEKINNGEQDIEKLPYLTPQELYPELWEKLKEKQKATDEFLYLKKPEAATDEYKCSRCKQRRCIYTELQTRSIDEPMTKYITCLECNHKWQIAG